MTRNAVLPVLLAVSLVACGGKKEEPGFLEGAQASATDTAAHPGSPGGTAVVPSTASGTTVLVTLADGRLIIGDADRIPPGPAIITASNTGTEVHSLFVEGPGVSRAPDVSNVPAGQNTSLNVTFQPGTYTLYCPLADHRNAGESMTLTIRPANAPAPTSTAVPTTPTTTGT